MIFFLQSLPQWLDRSLSLGTLLLSALLFGFVSLVFAEGAATQEIKQGESSSKLVSAKVVFSEAESTDCLIDDAKQVSLQLLDTSSDYEVWVDRWFLNVQTADHTKHRLTQAQSTVPLGCSKTYSGSQHWTIHSINPLKN